MKKKYSEWKYKASEKNLVELQMRNDTDTEREY